MPRRGPDRGSKSSSQRSESPRPRVRKAPSGTVDEQVLSLREAGASYSAIAGRLELHRAVDAHHAFIRALHRREGDDRHQLVTRESARLDQLERRIRQRDASEPEKLQRRLLGVDRLRDSLS